MWRKMIAAGVIAGGAVAPAGATIFTMTFYGTASEVQLYERQDVVSQVLTNVAYTSVYTIDDTKGTIYSSPSQSYFESAGGLTGLVTLAGVGSYAIAGNGGGAISTSNDWSDIGDSINADVANRINDFIDDRHIYSSVRAIDDFIAPVNGPYTITDFRQPMDYLLQPSDTSGSTFDYISYVTNLSNSTFESYARVAARVSLQRVVVAAAASPSDVPEPASWMMMIAGFGLVGGAMRRRSVRVRFV
ncbi:PEPxxWA-CTERM sorting domain-containing protein [Sphingomonas sp. AP4-R1]|uniref:PEPxxWA-CTERM sorting domain-containing protein n=1 Tax=Sphingomonas sp. AP4-R1 TaxID=2735134 RepID=UPI0014934DAE|nr:PEPxxWA-CTERM sorting domain-containing protein [Sphingomonas sp. AP4-R1]QJU56843.1 PEPxxWA-CTERM sorting domain-containing protein [Sphingomonas sp. AP4-R1]